MEIKTMAMDINTTMTDEQAMALMNGTSTDESEENKMGNNETENKATDTKELALPYEVDSIMKFGENQELQTTKITVKEFTTKIKKHVYNFDNEAQRGDVWNIAQRSKLIDSILRGIAVPCFYLNNRKIKVGAVNRNVYDVLDGRQRGTSLFMFVNDMFRLTGLDNIIVVDVDGNTHELELNGLLFSEMPEIFRNTVLDYSLEFWLYSDLTQDEVDELFLRINNGTALKAQDKARVGVKSKTELFELSAHPVFNKILTGKGLDNKDNQDIVMKSIIMMGDCEDKSTLNKHLSEYFEVNEITAAEVEALTQTLDFAEAIYDVMMAGDKDTKKHCKTWIKKSHFATSTSLLYKALKDGRTADEMADFLSGLFISEPKTPTSNEVYNEASRVGSGSKLAVMNRLEQLNVEYRKVFGDAVNASPITENAESEVVSGEVQPVESSNTETNNTEPNAYDDIADVVDLI